MKTLALLPLLSALLLFVSCSKSDTADSSAVDIATGTQKVSTGDWAVTQYTDSGKDETADYSGYRFQFNTDGTFFVTTSAGNYSGTWILSTGSSSGSSSDDSYNRLKITITGNKQMDDVSKNWLVVKISDNEIWLSDDNAASNEHIRFGR